LLVACPGSADNGLRPDGRSPADRAVVVDLAGTKDSPLPAEGSPTPDAPLTDSELQACAPGKCAGCCTKSGFCVAGVSDIECGNNGAACVDCAFKGWICQAQICAGCTPSCSGKACNSSDGCGGLCTTGSGCCTPDCTSKYCGEDDGCGGTCNVGSGCQVPECVYQTDNDTVILLTFSGSGSTVTDATGNHDGKIVNSSAKRVTGKTGCGKAMDFTQTSPISYVEIPNASAFDLKQGSVDFWVKFKNDTGAEGIVGRDALGTDNPGHLSISRLCNGAVKVRLQNTTTEGGRCSKQLPKGKWHHVAVNFGGSGGLKLYVDGSPANEPDVVCGTSTTKCGVDITTGIDGNTNPWVIGGMISSSDEGKATPIKGGLNGTVDSFRLSKVRRKFTP
jgi:hypothetical protein